jgi:hypothetical protein
MPMERKHFELRGIFEGELEVRVGEDEESNRLDLILLSFQDLLSTFFSSSQISLGFFFGLAGRAIEGEARSKDEREWRRDGSWRVSSMLLFTPGWLL